MEITHYFVLLKTYIFLLLTQGPELKKLFLRRKQFRTQRGFLKPLCFILNKLTGSWPGRPRNSTEIYAT